ncbi:3-deoxy-D-manno-octulosonic acid transferase [Pseudoruegeria sp. HB172150]|uniref:3-deoxy-D-manno-octulosonic acid transferase n=1 Tax=Pseudoruegeria sp. HB172150 TaxID=2721164 RepID=UPI001556D8FC|nr:glycosyltransferase N-terminal domain-containing protein [Pseudoruegeria sp. HB172150]
MLTYRILLSLAFPFVLARLCWRVLRGRETVADLGERLGGGGGRPGAVWLHGASNGELTSARPLVLALMEALPDMQMVVTANTVTGRDLVRGWGLPRVEARLAPLDLRWALSRFRRAWAPSLLIVMENELWPNRIVTETAPVICVGARMSARSHRRWSRFPALAARLLGGFRRLWPQDAASGRHFAALGLPEDRLGAIGTLKSAVELADPDPGLLLRYGAVYRRTDTVLAASTHEGEEDIVLAAFLAVLRSRPGLRLILAPRHPKRGAELAQMLRQMELRFARRSVGEEPDETTAVYLADTLGEMPLWYSLAGVTFVGGSFVARGGHTPFEPAAAGSAIVHGPDVSNFEGPYAALDRTGGAMAVLDGGELTSALLRLSTAEAQEAQAARAREILDEIGSSGALIAEITDEVRRLLGER